MQKRLTHKSAYDIFLLFMAFVLLWIVASMVGCAAANPSGAIYTKSAEIRTLAESIGDDATALDNHVDVAGKPYIAAIRTKTTRIVTATNDIDNSNNAVVKHDKKVQSKLDNVLGSWGVHLQRGVDIGIIIAILFGVAWFVFRAVTKDGSVIGDVGIVFNTVRNGLSKAFSFIFGFFKRTPITTSWIS